MEKDRISLLNIKIDNVTKQEFLEKLNSGMVVTPNIDHLMKLQKDREFYEIYQKAEHIVLDSRVIQKLMKVTGREVKDVIPGSEFFPEFCHYHKENPDIKIFLLGAADPVAQVAMDKINSRFDRDMVVGAHSPSFGFEKKKDEVKNIIDIVNNSGANVLAIGVSAPKQEKWVAQYRNQLKNIDIFLCIGATIDFEAGNIKRAPVFFRKLALEWLYRLFKEPKRMYKRYIIEDLPFFRLYFKDLKGKYINPFAN